MSDEDLKVRYGRVRKANEGRRTTFQYPGADTHLAVSCGLGGSQPFTALGYFKRERELPTNRCLETYSTPPYCIAKAILDIRVQTSNTVRTETVFPDIGTGDSAWSPSSRHESLKLGKNCRVTP